MKEYCGTCKYWTGEEQDGYRQCHYPMPKVPYWATIEPTNPDHGDWTTATDGRWCKVSQPVE